MARIRTIKPDFFQSEDNTQLSYRARLTWIGLWTYVDDKGRCKDNARLIKGHVWPLEDDVTAAEVEKDLAELSCRRRILRYEVDGESYLEVRKWLEHQRISKPSPSKIPARLPEPSGSPTGIRQESVSGDIFPEIPGVFEPSTTIPVGLPEPSANPPVVLPVGSGSGSGSGSGRKESDPGKPDARTVTPEHKAADDAYTKTGKAFDFIAVRGIAKWMIHERGLTAERASLAIVTVYESGKPITKTTCGQLIDGIGGNRKQTATDRVRDIAKIGQRLQAQQDQAQLQLGN